MNECWVKNMKKQFIEFVNQLMHFKKFRKQLKTCFKVYETFLKVVLLVKETFSGFFVKSKLNKKFQNNWMNEKYCCCFKYRNLRMCNKWTNDNIYSKCNNNMGTSIYNLISTGSVFDLHFFQVCPFQTRLLQSFKP